MNCRGIFWCRCLSRFCCGSPLKAHPITQTAEDVVDHAVKSVEVLAIENGKIKVLRHYFDLMTMLQQIGAMDPPVTALASRLHSAARDD